MLVAGRAETLYLLSTDGSWRSLPQRAEGAGAALTRDGARLAVQTPTGVDVWDLATGGRSTLPQPSRRHATDDVGWAWLDRGTLLFTDLGRGWRVDARTGRSARVPYPRGPWTVDDGGAVVETDWETTLTDWVSGEARRLDMSRTGRLEMFQVSGDTIVGTSAQRGPLAVYVVDRSHLRPRHVLHVRDPDARYGNGGLSVLALLDDGTVLLRLLVTDRSATSLRFVAWDPVSDELALVARTDSTLPLWSVAYDLLG